MAPLYKRYIPPKTPVEPAAAVPAPLPKVEPPAVTETPEKKRKRERTQDEVAERKAKKLRKKGIDPATVPDLDVSAVTENADQEQSFVSVQEADVSETTTSRPQGEFAHIKSDKKRHKLEKEARNARKAATKAAKLAGTDTAHDEGVDVGAARDEGPDDVTVTVNLDKQSKDCETEQRDEVVPVVESKEKVKRKKRRKEVAGDEAGGDESMLERSEVDAQELGEPTDTEATNAALKVKKRRHKLEGVFAEVQQNKDGAQSDEGEHLRNHGAVLDKFQKSLKRSQSSHQEEQFEKLPQHPVVRDLELPEPHQEPTPEFTSESATLPEWLAKPTIISNDSRATFQDLNLRTETADLLSKLGFKDALPVQQGLIPLLLQPGMPGSKFPPGTEAILPDVGVSAPTGSGKTIAYLLPVIEALRRKSSPGRLSALIIVPTRELVLQVAAVADSLTKGSSVKVGMATGQGKFGAEQEKLIKRGRRYDPEQHRRLMDQAKQQFCPTENDELDVLTSDADDIKADQFMQDAMDCLEGHVPTYASAVDLLVATPGRLLEHINNTLGFNLVHLQWLVIDEADKLLDNQYEGFLDSLNAELTRDRSIDEQDAREQLLRANGLWDEQRERRLRKVFLSATMTRDISKLSTLKLRRPKMVIVRGEDDDVQTNAGADDAEVNSGVKESADGFEIPRTLVEYCVPVGDGSEKPLIAVELLSSRIFREPSTNVKPVPAPQINGDADDSDSSSESDESSIVSSDDSDSSSDSDSVSDIGHGEAPEEVEPDIDLPLSRRTLMRPAKEVEVTAPTVLIFTASNEAANRLTHLLKGLKPQWSSRITTLVKTNPGNVRIRSKSNEPAVVVSTDRAARGLDSFSDQKGAKRPVTHVIQYDVPRTLTSYIHRVGRTARAGRNGDAWTLYTHAEARWFVNEITKARNVTRSGAVERVKIFMGDDALRERYQEVLAGMRDEVFGGGGAAA